ncbi:MAG: AAA family ATPase [Candidatus Nezhaarchaeales archaeon]
MPEKLLHREKEKADSSNNLKNFINTFICGLPGSGKATLVKHVIKNLNKKVIVTYIDCPVYQTAYSVLKEILPKSEFALCRSNYELIKELLKYARERRFAICFDNFEKLKEK